MNPTLEALLLPSLKAIETMVVQSRCDHSAEMHKQGDQHAKEAQLGLLNLIALLQGK